MSFPYRVIIPARYAATRLPGKPLLEIADKPLIQHVYESAAKSNAMQVLIATDDSRIKDTARSFNADVVMTSPEHSSGTDRLAEVINGLELEEDDIIVNVQGDEYGLPPVLIDQVARGLHDNPAHSMSTLCEKITAAEEMENPDIVKVVLNSLCSAILCISSAIPWNNGDGLESFCRGYRHIGIYAYRAGFLKEYTSLAPSHLEENERLEQLRTIYHGYSIHVQEAEAISGIGIDTPADLELARKEAEKRI